MCALEGTIKVRWAKRGDASPLIVTLSQISARIMMA